MAFAHHPFFRPLWRFAAASCVLALSACADVGPARALRVATGFASRHICSDTLLSGMRPEAARAERVSTQGAMRWVDPWMSVTVDSDQHEVRATLAGAFSQRARFTPGYGCRLLDADEPAPMPAPLLAESPAPWLDEIAGPQVVHATSPALAAAIALAFDEPDGPGMHQTKAVLVLHDGRVIAERYAPGSGPDTPWLGFSMSKSLTNALLGVLVQQGKLTLDQDALLPAWSGWPGSPADVRSAITVEQLLRQTSGLDLVQDNSGFDANSRMLFIERDQAAFAAARPLARPPGQQWHYTDGHFILLSRLLRNATTPAVGADAAAAVRAFAHRHLFAPLGMQQFTMEFDATGTPQGASFFFGSARDWARLGELFRLDGMLAGHRLLPAGWVAMSTRPTLATGYGAGWWTNTHGGDIYPVWGVPWGFANAPRDAYFARGFMGQFTLVIPSERLVIVRLGISHRPGDDISFVDRMVGAIRAALALPDSKPATGH